MGAEPMRPEAQTADQKREVAACVESYEGGQILKKRARLKEAEQTLAKCMDEKCPGSLRKECAGWLDEIRGRMPSIVLQCEEPGAAPTKGVTISVDGSERKDVAFGRAFEIDPGEHRFEISWQEPKMDHSEKSQVVIEKQQQMVKLRCRTDVPEAPAKVIVKKTGVPTATLVVGGVGIAATIFGGVFLADGLLRRGDLNDCKGTCKADDVSRGKLSFLLADIGIGVGVAAIAVAGALWILAPKTTEGKSGARIWPLVW
jgi:hypothetical protein